MVVLITFVKEVMFLPRFDCGLVGLSVSRIAEKLLVYFRDI